MKILLIAICSVIVFESVAFADTTKEGRINAAAQLTERLSSSKISNFQIHAFAKGKNCEILHVESLNLLPPMMEALATGSLVYGQAIPGGVNNYAGGFDFKAILYTSRADNSFVSYGDSNLSRSSIKKMQACSIKSSNSVIKEKSAATNKGANSQSAAAGKELIRKIHKKYNVHNFYSEPNIQGSRMVIWLPDSAWKNMSPKQKDSIREYMRSRYPNKDIGVGIGIMDRRDIVADDIIPL